MEHPSYQRKTHLIKKDFQIKFIVKFCLIVLAGVILSTALLFLFSQDTLTSSFDDSKLVIRKTGSAILPAVVYTNLITLGVVCIVTIFVTLYISHKIAGPMFRFEKEIKTIGQGNLCKKIVLRKQDQVKEMADSLNHMVHSLHDKVYEIYHEIDILEQTATEQKNPDQMIDRIKTLKQKVKKNFIL